MKTAARAAEHREWHDRLIDSKGGHMLSTCYTKLSREDQEGRHEPKAGVFLIEGMCEMAGETFLTTLTTMARTSMHCHSTIVHREIITPRTTCSVPQFGPASILPLIASPTHPLPLV